MQPLLQVRVPLFIIIRVQSKITSLLFQQIPSRRSQILKKMREVLFFSQLDNSVLFFCNIFSKHKKTIYIQCRVKRGVNYNGNIKK